MHSFRAPVCLVLAAIALCEPGAAEPAKPPPDDSGKPCCVCVWDDAGADKCEAQKDRCGSVSVIAKPSQLPGDTTSLDGLAELSVPCYLHPTRGCISWNLDGCLKKEAANRASCSSFSIIPLSQYDVAAQAKACGAATAVNVGLFSHGFPVTFTGRPFTTASCDARRDEMVVEICRKASPACKAIGIEENACYIAADMGEFYKLLEKIQADLNGTRQCDCTVTISAHQLQQHQNPACPDVYPLDRVTATVTPQSCAVSLPSCESLKGKECPCTAMSQATQCTKDEGGKPMTTAIRCEQVGTEPRCQYTSEIPYEPLLQDRTNPRR